MVTFLQDAATRPRPGPSRPGRPLSPAEAKALATAPRRDTRVTVRAYDIPWLPGPAEHMYAEYDDGVDRLIVRGGPSHFGDALSGNMSVVSEVTDAATSKDRGKGGRVMFRGVLPGRSAQDAVQPARRQSELLARTRPSYSLRANSNSVAADDIERQFGVRPGDRLTPGFDRRLSETRRVAPYDLSPALRILP